MPLQSLSHLHSVFTFFYIDFNSTTVLLITFISFELINILKNLIKIQAESNHQIN